MEQSYWLKQEKDKPLFPDLIWSRPENKAHGGKLLIVGGNIHSFNAVNLSYQESLKAGAGSVKVILPDVLQKTLSKLFPEADYAASTPSGGFSLSALAAFIEMSGWSDEVLLAGDFSKNSETAILIEKYIAKYGGLLTLANDAVDIALTNLEYLTKRENTIFVVSYAQLTKMSATLKYHKAFISSLDLMQIIDLLHDFTKTKNCTLVVLKDNIIFVAAKGKVSTTIHNYKGHISLTKIASQVSVWALHNPNYLFEAATTAALADN